MCVILRVHATPGEHSFLKNLLRYRCFPWTPREDCGMNFFHFYKEAKACSRLPWRLRALLSVSVVLQTLHYLVLVLSSIHVFLLSAQFWETKPWPAFSIQSTWTKLVCDLPQQSLVHGDSGSGVASVHRAPCPKRLRNLTPALF